MRTKTALPILMLLVLTAALAAVTASARAIANGSADDGLPSSWFGYTKWTGPGSIATVASVTLALTGKASYANQRSPYYLDPAGTLYGYTPVYKYSVIKVLGQCTTAVTARLEKDDGGLTIDVAKGGKVPRAAYWGQQNQTLQKDLPQSCPNGYRPDRNVTFWGFETEPITAPLLRPMSTNATKIEGKYVDPSYGVTFEWCFVRAAQLLSSCGPPSRWTIGNSTH
jgi:hypothetical protein